MISFLLIFVISQPNFLPVSFYQIYLNQQSMNPSRAPRQSRFNRTAEGRISHSTNQETKSSQFKKKPKMSLDEESKNQDKDSMQKKVSLELSRSSHHSVFSSIHTQLLSNPPEIQELDVLEVFKQNQQLKIMQLSEDCRENLKKMQRFDRFIYPMQSDRILKVPVQREVKRLEKIKNENPRMRAKIYDNELTITALYNHVKLLYEMNKELEEREVLRRQKETLSQRLHEMTINTKKQVRELKDQIRQQSQGTSPMKLPPKPRDSSAKKENDLSKDEIIALNFIGATIQGGKYAQALQQIKDFIKKNGDKEEICKIMKIITKTIEEHITIEKSITTLESAFSHIKNLIEKVNKVVRLEQFDELQKIKNQNIRGEYKDIALLVQSILAMVKNIKESAEKNKKLPDPRIKDRSAAKTQKLQEDLKKLKEELSKQKILVAEHIKSKNQLQRQLKTLQNEQENMKNLEKKKIEESRQIGKLTTELTSLKNVNKSLEKTIQDLNKSLEQQKSLPPKPPSRSVDTKMEKQLQILKKSEASLRESLEQAKKSQNNIISKLRAELSESKSTITELNKKVKDLQQKIQTKNVQSLTNLRNREANQEISKYKEELSKCKEEIAELKRNQKLLQEEKKMRLSVQTEIKTLRSNLQKQKQGAQVLKTSINKITTLFRSTVRPQQLTRIRRQLQSTEQTRKMIQIYDEHSGQKSEIESLKKELANLEKQQQIELESNRKNYEKQKKQIEDSMRDYAKVTGFMENVYKILDRKRNQFIKKNVSIGQTIAVELKRQKISDPLGITAQFSNLSNWIQELYSQEVKKAETDLSQYEEKHGQELKSLQIQFNEYRKQFAGDEQIHKNVSKNMKNLYSALTRMRGDQLFSNGRIIDLYKKELSALKNSKYEVIVEGMQQIVEYIVNSSNDEMVKKQDQFQRRIQNLEEEKTRINEQLQKVQRESQEKAHEYRQIQNIKKDLNREIDFLRKTNVRIENEKSALENRDNENNSQMIKLKKVSQEYLKQQKKFLEKLETIQREKQRLSIENDALQRTIQRQSKQKQFYEQNLKKQDSEVLKLKQIEILYDNSYKDYELKIQILQNNLNTKQKEILQFQQKNKIMHQEKMKQDSLNNQLERALNKKKEEMHKMETINRDKIDQLDRDKYELNKIIDQLKTEIKYINEQSEGEKRRLQTALKKQENVVTKIEQETAEERKQLQERLAIIIKEKESQRDNYERQQIKYREKLREVSFKLQETTGTDEREKIQLKKQIERINNELAQQTYKFTSERQELRRQVERLGNQLQRIESERIEEKRAFREEVERARNEEYESSKEKINKLRSEIKELEGDINKYTQLIKINEVNYKKIIEDNKGMYQKILSLQKEVSELDSELKISSDENEKNRELASYIEILEVKVKDLQRQIHKQEEEQTVKVDEMEKNNAIRMREKYEHLNEFERVTKENISLKTDIKNLQQQATNNQKFIRELQKERGELERHLKEKEHQVSQKNNILFQQEYTMNQKDSQISQKNGEIGRLQQEATGYKRQIDSKDDIIKNIEKESKIVLQKFSESEKSAFQNEIHLKKEIEIIRNKWESVKSELHEIKFMKESLETRERENLKNIEDHAREITNLKIQNNKLERDIIYWKQKAEKKQQDLLSMSNNHAQLHKSATQNTEIWRRQGITQTQNTQLKLKNEQIQAKLKQNENSLQRMRSQCDQYIKSLQHKNIEILTMAKVKEQLLVKNKSYEIENSSKELNFKSTIDSLERTKQELLKKLKFREEESENIRKKYQDKLEKFFMETKELQRKISSMKQNELKLMRQIDSAESLSKQNQRSVMMLQNQLKSKKEAIEQKDRQILLMNTNFIKLQEENKIRTLNSSNSTMNLLENSLQQKKRQTERLQSQLGSLMKINQDKSEECTRLQLQIKQHQMEKKMVEEKLKQRCQNLTQKLKEERQRWRMQKLKLEESVSKLTLNNASLKDKLDSMNFKLEHSHSELEKMKITSQNIGRREKEYRERYITKEEELKKVYQKEETILNGNYKIKEENKHLKQLLQMLDENYIADNEEDLNEIDILMKISDEISELITRNIWLEKQLKRATLESDDPWYESLDILVESVANHVYENNLIDKKIRMPKYLESDEFRNKYDKDIAIEKFMMHIQNFLRSLISSVSESVGENEVSTMYEKTLWELKSFVSKFQQTKQQIYLDSLIRCLNNFEP